MICPQHPVIVLPYMLTCPLCAQEARRTAYAAQRALGTAQLAAALQRPPEATDEAA